MFCGIIQTTTHVTHVLDKANLKSFSVSLDNEMRNGLAIGASVAIDGVCMTVVRIENDNVYFDAVQETLDKTTIGQLNEGSYVNVERSVKVGDEIGGHHVSGHVHGRSKIVDIDKTLDNNHVISFKVPDELVKYVFNKGFIALNGTSLTIVDVDQENKIIRVSLIPETLRQTTFYDKNVNDEVNIEIEQQTQTIVDTVEKVLASQNK